MQVGVGLVWGWLGTYVDTGGVGVRDICVCVCIWEWVGVCGCMWAWGGYMHHTHTKGICITHILAHAFQLPNTFPPPQVQKNKVARPFAAAECDMYFSTGFDKVGAAVEAAVHMGMLQRRGAYYYDAGTQLGQGRASVIAHYMENPEELRYVCGGGGREGVCGCIVVVWYWRVVYVNSNGASIAGKGRVCLCVCMCVATATGMPGCTDEQCACTQCAFSCHAGRCRIVLHKPFTMERVRMHGKARWCLVMIPGCWIPAAMWRLVRTRRWHNNDASFFLPPVCT